MSNSPKFPLGQFMKGKRVAKGLVRPGQLARRMRPGATQEQIARLGTRIRDLEEIGNGSRELFDEMVRALAIPAAELQPLVDEERRILAARREAESIKGNPVLDLLRGAVQNMEPLRRLHPWVPFPQNMTCYSFGPEKLPLPIGAMFELWERSAEFRAPCPRCKTGTVYGYAFGGLFSLGGVLQYCIDCGEPAMNNYGGFCRVKDLATELLAGTPYFVSRSAFGAAFPGERRPLVDALRSLGWKVEISEVWLAQSEVSGVSLHVRGETGKTFFFES